MSDLASSNGVAINDVNGRIGNTKPGANVNAVPQWKVAKKVSVAKLRFSSTSCLNVCRSDPYFVI